MSFRTDRKRGRYPITPRKGIKEVDLNVKEKGVSDTIKISIENQARARALEEKGKNVIRSSHEGNLMQSGLLGNPLTDEQVKRMHKVSNYKENSPRYKTEKKLFMGVPMTSYTNLVDPNEDKILLNYIYTGNKIQLASTGMKVK